MKNILFKSLAAVVLLGGLSSCSDFLDQSSPSSLDGKNIFSNYEYAQGTIANIKNLESRTIVHVPFGMDTIRI